MKWSKEAIAAVNQAIRDNISLVRIDVTTFTTLNTNVRNTK